MTLPSCVQQDIHSGVNCEAEGTSQRLDDVLISIRAGGDQEHHLHHSEPQGKRMRDTLLVHGQTSRLPCAMKSVRSSFGLGLPKVVLAFAVVLGAEVRAEPQAWIDAAYYGFGSGKSVAGGALGSQHLMLKIHGHPAERLDAGIPAGIPIEALSIDSGDIYLVTAVSWRLNDQRVSPRDVIRIADGGATSIAMRGVDMGLPSASRIVALSIGDGEVLLSLDIHADFGAFKSRPSDILQWDGSALSKAYGADAMGIPEGTKLTAFDRTATGSLLMAFDAGAEIQGIEVMPGDLLEFRPAANAWSRARARDNLGVTCFPCDLTAIAADTNATTVFRDGLEID